MDQPAHETPAVRRMRIRSEEEELVDRAKPAIGVAADKVGIHRFKIGGANGRGGQA